MARDKQKKRKRAASAPRDNTKWARRLTEALGNLQWEEATPEDLATVLLQLPQLARLAREELHETAPGDEEDEVEVAEKASNVPLLDELERLIAHDVALVRCAAWEALRDASLEAPSLSAAAVARGLHRTALSQLCASTAAAAAAGPDGATADLWVRLLGVVWNFAERHEEVVAAVGTADIAAVAKCLTVNAAAVLSARAATVETAAAAAEAAGEEGGGSDLADVVHLTEQGVAATAWQLLLVLTDCQATHAATLVANADWRDAVSALFRLSSAAADAPPPTALAEAERRACSVLCAAVALAVGAQTSLGAEGEEIIANALLVIADAARWGGDATDAARKLALEAIANAYAADDGDAHAAWLRARVVALLPPRTLLAPDGGALLAALAPALAAAADAAAPPAAASSSTEPATAAAPGADVAEELALRYLQCVGAALVAADSDDEAAAADVDGEELRAAATAVARALLPSVNNLSAFEDETREELLRLMSTATSWRVPVDLQVELCGHASRWPRAAGATARAAAVALVGDVLRRLRTAAVEPELVHWLQQRKEPLAAAEAAAALHDAGRAADAVAAVLPGLRSRIEMVDWLGEEEKAHALELLDGVSPPE